jgi:hypothetical protein
MRIHGLNTTTRLKYHYTVATSTPTSFYQHNAIRPTYTAEQLPSISVEMTSALLSPDTITTPAAADHACCFKQCGRLWTDSLSNLESDGSPTTVGRLRRKTGEKIESLLETIRDSYLQIDDFLSYIYENRDTRQHRKRWRQLERWFMGSVDKGRFGSKVLKSWLLQGGGETIFGIYQAELDTLFKTSEVPSCNSTT